MAAGQAAGACEPGVGRRGDGMWRMIVHVVDGTYELFRHFYGLRRFNKGRTALSAR
jgi:hypothetical protein